jgi:hypothetical protein
MSERVERGSTIFGSVPSRPPHPLELTAETLARPALAADRLDPGGDLADDRRWAVVDIAGDGDRLIRAGA